MFTFWRKSFVRAKVPKTHESHNAALIGSLKLAVVGMFTKISKCCKTGLELLFY